MSQRAIVSVALFVVVGFVGCAATTTASPAAQRAAIASARR